MLDLSFPEVVASCSGLCAPIARFELFPRWWSPVPDHAHAPIIFDYIYQKYFKKREVSVCAVCFVVTQADIIVRIV